MVYPEIIHGMFVDLRSITLDDAEFSYNIRADKRNRDTVGQLAPSLEAQKEYIRWQMQEPNDYYFVVLNKRGERVGLIGAYDMHEDIIEVGREVNNGEPMESMEAEVLIRRFCHEILGLDKICGVIYANNKKHISDAVKIGGQNQRLVKRGEQDALYFEYDLLHENSMMRKIKKLLEKVYLSKKGNANEQ